MQVDAEWAGQVVDWLDQHRHSVGPFLEKIHVNRHGLGHGEKISAANLAAIMEFGEACTGDHHFGLHRGDEFRSEIGGLLAYLAMCSETVEEGFDNLKRYVSISSESFVIDLNKDQASCKLVLRVSDPVWARCKHLSEFAFARFLKCLRLITNSRLRPLRVQFMHRGKEPDLECQRFFGSSVNFARKVDTIEFAQNILGMRTQYCRQALKPIPPKIRRRLAAEDGVQERQVLCRRGDVCCRPSSADRQCHALHSSAPAQYEREDNPASPEAGRSVIWRAGQANATGSRRNLAGVPGVRYQAHQLPGRLLRCLCVLAGLQALDRSQPESWTELVLRRDAWDLGCRRSIADDPAPEERHPAQCQHRSHCSERVSRDPFQEADPLYRCIEHEYN